MGMRLLYGEAFWKHCHGLGEVSSGMLGTVLIYGLVRIPLWVWMALIYYLLIFTCIWKTMGLSILIKLSTIPLDAGSQRLTLIYARCGASIGQHISKDCLLIELVYLMHQIRFYGPIINMWDPLPRPLDMTVSLIALLFWRISEFYPTCGL